MVNIVIWDNGAPSEKRLSELYKMKSVYVFIGEEPVVVVDSMNVIREVRQVVVELNHYAGNKRQHEENEENEVDGGRPLVKVTLGLSTKGLSITLLVDR